MTALQIGGRSHDAVAWASCEEISQAMMAEAVFLQRYPVFGGGSSQPDLCLCLLTSVEACANHLARWTAGQRRNRSP